MYLKMARILVAKVRRMVVGLGERAKEGMEERQGLNNRGPVLGNLETATVPEGGGGGLHLEVEWFFTFPMQESNPCSVIIGRILSKELNEKARDGVPVH